MHCNPEFPRVERAWNSRVDHLTTCESARFICTDDKFQKYHPKYCLFVRVYVRCFKPSSLALLDRSRNKIYPCS